MGIHIKSATAFAAVAVVACGLGLSIPNSHPQTIASGTHHHLTTEQKIDNRIKHMTLNEKIGQLFVTAVSNNKAATKHDIKKYHLGGIILMGNNFVGTKSSFKSRLKSYQHSAKIPLTISTDQEGGTVSRLSSNKRISGHSYYLSPQQALHRGGMKKVLSMYRYQAKQLHSLGINWNFAPVADVSTKHGSFIYDRTIGKGYKKTAYYISKSIPTIQSQHVAATLKHFPGYGSAADTHTGSAGVNRSLKSFKTKDFIPFKAGIKNGVDSVMVTHIILKKIDPHKPASLSKKDISLLRNDLNFKGVIVSDSLQMQAVGNYAVSHHLYRDVAAFKAGNDVLLTSDYKRGIPQLRHAVAKKQISVKHIDASVKRILTMKAKTGLNID
ncbi:glycoside hydrolase family 3 N-terminal domain-containing protein [Lentilactobacillus kefiri]|uniref:beta-N-acetylhexosaminidase n=2 Tax=Lentilactobacillus kefiri TaxID=33962 RepID=A0A8E1RHP8_LENKE|nr:glycoside hydrolase family 3 N-terminal domain-containing protein [Lentilactobacillus kefiri]KRL73666.1 glycosyl hydrolase family 3 protein [Lentilactobacillus parakefiri DSM 10551]KRM49770.1 glycosyl hydrolase family 3 protein [Lentilactobacillus kefiri DSM 20587 = JCM 5818]MCJ2161588.1 beta-N-acetylhexosaminidase [Lentilactobacillus kefiri]MCP9368177.1 beta-N-acetylhexosaminidase [Lentilactobacillus kefiri]MDH5108243.1 beta-N-acetylhexosaminidase [Lentilactobacillus kefiri]